MSNDHFDPAVFLRAGEALGLRFSPGPDGTFNWEDTAKAPGAPSPEVAALLGKIGGPENRERYAAVARLVQERG